MTPKPVPIVSLGHLHAPAVSVREQAGILSGRLRRVGQATFRALTSDCEATVEVVARFLALLEMFRDGAVAFEQAAPLSDLLVRWTGQTEDGDDPRDVETGAASVDSGREEHSHSSGPIN